MAKLVSVVREEHCRFDRRQLPLRIDDNLIMIMQLNDACMTCDRTVMKGKEMERFVAKYNRLSSEELETALVVNSKYLFQQLAVSVPCIGCRRSVERLFTDLVESGYPALEPLIVTSGAAVSLMPEYQRQPKALATLFHIHAPKLSSIIKALPKSKKNQRCVLHSLDIQRSRPLSNWLEVWETMSRECREAVVLIEADMLLDTLEAYLRKHRFCVECRNKVLRAYHILVGDADPSKEKGYLSSLYEGIRICPPPDKHIHVQGSVEFIDALIARAEPELMGNHGDFSRRERHAKTIEIAQEEVLTCLGICLYERLHKIQQRSCEEELTWELLFCLAVEALQKNFELAIEDKQGVSQLELLCEEMAREEQEKQQRKEQKRLKKKQRKQKDKKASDTPNGATTPTDERDSDHKDERLLMKKDVLKERNKGEKSSKSSNAKDVAMTTVTTTVIRRRSDGCVDVDPRHCVVVPGYDEDEESAALFEVDSSSFEEVKSSKKSRNQTNASGNNVTNSSPNRGAAEPSSCVQASSTTSNGGGNRKKRRNRQAAREVKLAKKQEVAGDQKNQHENVQPPRFARKQQQLLGKTSTAKKSVLPSVKPADKSAEPTPAVVNGTKAVNGKDDYGYCSSSVSSSSNEASEGSDICSEGFCNHESSECTAQCDLLAETNSTSSHDESSTGRALNSPDVGKMFERARSATADCGMRTCESPRPFSALDADFHYHPAPGYMTLLEQMLGEDEYDDSDEGESLIPPDEIKHFENQLGGKVEEKRAKLREDLKQKFARLCNVAGSTQ